MLIAKNIPAEAETPPQPDTYVDTEFYLKLQVTLKVILFPGWGVFIQQFQFNELDNRMSNLKKGQNINKSM